MLTAVRGPYNGVQIVPDETVDLQSGQEVIITILNIPARQNNEGKLDLEKYMGRGEKLFDDMDAQEYVGACGQMTGHSVNHAN